MQNLDVLNLAQYPRLLDRCRASALSNWLEGNRGWHHYSDPCRLSSATISMLLVVFPSVRIFIGCRCSSTKLDFPCAYLHDAVRLTNVFQLTLLLLFISSSFLLLVLFDCLKMSSFSQRQNLSRSLCYLIFLSFAVGSQSTCRVWSYWWISGTVLDDMKHDKASRFVFSNSMIDCILLISLFLLTTNALTIAGKIIGDDKRVFDRSFNDDQHYEIDDCVPLAFGDFNADKVVDIFCRNTRGDSLRVMLNNDRTLKAKEQYRINTT